MRGTPSMKTFVIPNSVWKFCSAVCFLRQGRVDRTLEHMSNVFLPVLVFITVANSMAKEPRRSIRMRSTTTDDVNVRLLTEWGQLAAGHAIAHSMEEGPLQHIDALYHQAQIGCEACDKFSSLPQWQPWKPCHACELNRKDPQRSTRMRSTARHDINARRPTDKFTTAGDKQMLSRIQ